MHTMNMASGGLMWRSHRCCLCLCRRHTSRWHCMHVAVAGRSHIIDIHVVDTTAADHRSLVNLHVVGRLRWLWRRWGRHGCRCRRARPTSRRLLLRRCC